MEWLSKPGLNIGFLSRYPPMHCGVGEYTRMLVSALKSVAPWTRITVFTSTLIGEEPWVDEELGVDVIPSFAEKGLDYSKLPDLIAERGRVDILHVEHEYGIFGTSKELINILERLEDEGLVKKTVITMHSVLHPYSGRLEEISFQRELNRFDAVIVHSVLQEFELQWQGIEPRRIHRIPHGTLINPYLGYPKNLLARSLGLNEEKLRGLVLVVPGFLRLDKGLDVLFNAIGYMGDLNSTIVVAGEPQDKSIIELIEDARTRLNIVLIEKYLSNEEILRVIGLADILVLPYKDKPGIYSVSGILHLSMGGLKPIVGSRTPRLVELYQYAPRLTVPARAPRELAEKIQWVTNNYDYAVAYMATLYSYAARTQWHRMARRHLKLYTKLLVGKEYEIVPEEETHHTTL